MLLPHTFAKMHKAIHESKEASLEASLYFRSLLTQLSLPFSHSRNLTQDINTSYHICCFPHAMHKPIAESTEPSIETTS